MALHDTVEATVRTLRTCHRQQEYMTPWNVVKITQESLFLESLSVFMENLQGASPLDSLHLETCFLRRAMAFQEAE
uniref:Interleukin-19 n=1 Tax=Steinernema glaseri TaxID=37863 RepID=A0A1I7YMR9_9BILA